MSANKNGFEISMQIALLGRFIGPFVEILRNSKKTRIEPEVIGLPSWTGQVFSSDWIIVPNELLQKQKEITRQLHDHKRRLCVQVSGEGYFLPREDSDQWEEILGRLRKEFDESVYKSFFVDYDAVKRETERKLLVALKDIHRRHRKDSKTLWGELTDQDAEFFTRKLMEERFPPREKLASDYKVGCRTYTTHPDDPDGQSILEEIKELINIKKSQGSLF